ncbi:hypothetical protein [Terracidiphilus gabretensis]|uniref:hypothetical protein n=1 Tax=Terracidiphilus gabretensis TaxID=1577687 RepID=UPI00071BA8DF|nr:hypothetical protein [Terracidiphilus gabretensis]
MRRSREIQLTLLASLALTSLTACRDEPQHCVDGRNRLLPDSSCQVSNRPVGAHYVYGGSSGGHVGDAVVGSSVSRGGFGGSAEGGEGHSGGGEGGGE